MKSVLVYFLVTILLSCLPGSYGLIHSAKEMKMIIENFNLSKYSKDISPPTANGPVEVEMGIFLRNLRSAKPRQLNLELSFYFFWKDDRLKYKTNKSSFVVLPLLPGEFIWQPDVWIMDEQSGQTSYSVDQMIEIRPQGMVEQVRRLSLNLFCAMDYFYFPFDKQVCRVRFQSFAHSNDEVQFYWWNNRTGKVNSWIASIGAFFSNIPKEVEVSNQYILHSYKLSKSVMERKLGNFDHLVLKMKLKRSVVEYWFRYFIPLNLVVVLSMTSFWIDHKSIPARVTIPVISMLTLQKIVVNLKSKLPYSGEVLMLEWFLNVEILFVLAVLLQFCMVSVSKINEIKQEKRTLEETSKNITMVGAESYLSSECNQKNTFKLSQISHRNDIVHPIDKTSRKFFPLLHIVINATYFLINAFIPDYE